MSNTPPLSSRIYARLLALYPENLRREYGADMALVFAEDLDTARREAGIRGVIRVWRCVLGEFLRISLPGCASSSAVRVPAISFVLCLLMLGGVTVMAMRHAPDGATYFHAVRVALLLPLFSTPFIALLSVWVCRGSEVISLHSSNGTGEEH
jgi:hypothetical protein